MYAADLGWKEPVTASTRKVSFTPDELSKPPSIEILAEEARVRPHYPIGRTILITLLQQHRLSLLTSLSGYLGRVRLLRQAESKLQTTKSLMGKGSARKAREARFVEDENAPEDRNGEKKRFEGKLWKWKLERRK